MYEDANTFAFLDIKPVNPGHTLVLPKNHARNIFDISANDMAAVMETARMLAPKLREATNADGLNVHINNEPAGGQLIFHSHVHLIPRFEGDGYEHWLGKEVGAAELEDLRKKITALL